MGPLCSLGREGGDSDWIMPVCVFCCSAASNTIVIVLLVRLVIEILMPDNH